MERRDYQKELRANIEHYVRNASTKNLSEDEVQTETEGLYKGPDQIAVMVHAKEWAEAAFIWSFPGCFS